MTAAFSSGVARIFISRQKYRSTLEDDGSRLIVIGATTLGTSTRRSLRARVSTVFTVLTIDLRGSLGLRGCGVCFTAGRGEGLESML